MDYPESLRAAISKATAKHRDDIDQAVDCAEREWVKTSEYGEWVAEMVRGQIRSMIHDARHAENVSLRKEAGEFGQAAKVGLSTGAANNIAKRCLLDTYVICGKRLGDIQGKELSGFAAQEQERAEGHVVNARLCKSLASMVAEEKTVRQCVSNTRAVELLRAAMGKRRRAVAAA